MKCNPKFIVKSSDELTNEEYHDPDSWCGKYVSGSSLGEIYATCPAAWKYKPREETKALVFGTQSHTVMLEVERFNQTYRRAPLVSEVKDAITSQTALASKLKACGLIGTSGKQYPELIEMMVKNEIDLNVMWLIDMIAECQAKADGVELVKAEDYDACMSMRATLLNIPAHAEVINSETAMRELSIFGEIFGVLVKVRIDHVDKLFDVTIDGVYYPEVVIITDYKTTQSVKPEEFGKHAFNFGYYLKMALQRDLFKAAFNETAPIIVRLLAQEKKEPYLPMSFDFTDVQLAIGRSQYTSVIHQFNACQESNIWPSYENNAPRVKLPTPSWVEYQYKDFFTQSN